MLRSYLLTAFRALKNRPSVTTINVLGLAVGLAACTVIGLWVQQQLRYDRFHPQAETIYRVALEATSESGTMRAPVSPPVLAQALERDVPSVAVATTLDDQPEAVVQVDGTDAFVSEEVLQADAAFFQVFRGFSILDGSPDDALSQPGSAVLTASAAQRYFGTRQAVGRTVTVNDSLYQVSAVMADVPASSHVQFDLVLATERPQSSELWLQNSTYTYARLHPNSEADAFRKAVSTITDRYVGPQAVEMLGMTMAEFREQSGIEYFTQPLTSIHLHSNMQYELQPTGSITYVWVFSAVALFILLLACINFTNLATARATERAGEIGMRKALGAHRGQLAGQFLGEAVLTAIVAAGVAVVLLAGGVPVFNDLAGTDLTLAPILSVYGVAAAAGIVGVGLLAGLYPALVLSGFAPSHVLNSGRSSSGGSGSSLRETLVVLQFAVTIAMIAATGVVWNQFDYIQTKRLGLDREHVVVIDRASALGEQQETLKEQWRRLPNVAAVGAADAMFDVGQSGINNFNFVPDDRPAADGKTVATVDVDAGFTEVMNTRLVAGRAFDRSRAADTSAVIINQAAVKAFGFDDAPTTHTVRTVGSQGETYRVIGVVENFHLTSLRQPVGPMLMGLVQSPNKILVRVEPGGVQEALASMQESWASFVPDRPMDYSFANARFTELHADTLRTGRLFLIFAGLAMVVACFGLFGLAMYTAQRRTKEIGIRKAVGATAAQIVMLLSRRFLRLVGIAFVVAVPLAWLAMQRWLEHFAYRVDLGAGVFVLAGGLAVSVALATVSIHALRAARLDPATTLRDE